MFLTDNPLVPLSFVAGPAILANTCAILQNGTNIRYGHAVEQWRMFQASLALSDCKVETLYVDPAAAIRLSGKRIRLQLRELDLALAASCLFGLTSLFALAWSLLLTASPAINGVAAVATLLSGGAGLALLFSVAATIMLENRCAVRLMGLHLPFTPSFPTETSHDHS